MFNKKQNKKKGVSFYELIISLFLINLVIFSVLSVITMLLKGSQQVSGNSKTAVVANSIMNLYMTDDLTLDDTNKVEEKNDFYYKDFAGIRYYFKIEETVVRASGIRQPGLNQIVLRVSSDERFPSDPENIQNIKLTTLKTVDKNDDLNKSE